MKRSFGYAALALLLATTALPAASGGTAGELRFSLHAEPQTLDPLLMADESEETLRYLTEGVLVRINRLTQQPEAELAASWKIDPRGRSIVFELRRGVTFPDGSAFTSQDVVHTFHCLLDPALHSAIADTFKTEKGTVRVSPAGPYTVLAEFPAPVSGIERMFDQVAIVSARATKRPAPGLGPFLVARREPGVAILLKRNPTYWKRDANGGRLPRVDWIRLDIQQNRNLEVLKFLRGDVHLIDKLTPDLYEKLKTQAPIAVVDAGPTLDTDFLWFNLAPQSPLPAFKKDWFRSVNFRRAVSQAINRPDLCRVVYRGHASPAAGLISPTNRLWFKQGMTPESFDPAAARKGLAADGFRWQGSTLRDRAG
ncbi:MAG: ABC transporter substrate-binding protein, partial [Bryobacteraceae bacterium]